VPILLGLVMGTTLAFFQQVGKGPSLRRWLKSLVRWARVLRERSRNIKCEIPSFPVADRSFRESIFLLTS